VALAFICGVALLFALLLVCEGQPGSDEPLRPAGLLRWLISGNWTAKLGALLLTIGSGALLRYLMLNLSYPPALKMLTGAALAALFGVAAALLAARPGRRALSLALTGAALAAAYLTAYSAYEFFHFVADPQALGLLFIVACVATVLAITRRSVSLAVLAMAGAYLAPAFALHGNDPVPVYGYYAIASLITLFPVATSRSIRTLRRAPMDSSAACWCMPWMPPCRRTIRCCGWCTKSPHRRLRPGPRASTLAPPPTPVPAAAAPLRSPASSARSARAMRARVASAVATSWRAILISVR
jgi:hypothetical protein